MRIWLPAALAGLSLVVGLTVPAGPPYAAPDVPGSVLAVVSALCLRWSWTAPLRTCAAVSALLILNAAAGYTVMFVQWPAWIALFACFVRYGDVPRRAAAVAAAVAAIGGYAALDRGDVALLDLSGIAMCLLIATVGGDAARSRRALTAADEARLLLEERARMARELHDAVGHAVNVMVLQAAVGRRDPAFAPEALGHIETVGRGAIDELDRLLRVLDPRAPGAAGLDLGELAGRVRAAGRRLDLDAEPVDLAPGLALAVERIVQEAVTNALRHSRDGRIRVRLGRVADEVRLEVLNEGAGFAEPVPGRGLANMRRRALSEGGDLRAGPEPSGFAVRATFPARP